MLSGSCLCGGVKYQAAGPVTALARCHCVQCRKASGSEFASNGSVLAAHFELLSGQALLRRYQSSPGEFRVFCGNCGSPLFKESASRPEEVRLRLGCLDSELPEGPAVHVFVREKPSWSAITDDLPQYQKLPGD
jgi:hypothetical protein